MINVLLKNALKRQEKQKEKNKATQEYNVDTSMPMMKKTLFSQVKKPNVYNPNTNNSGGILG